MALIKTVDELRKYVRITRSKDWESFEMYLDDAQEKYIEPYFGAKLLETLEAKPSDKLTLQICRSLGPFALALATNEMSINFGEAGHTVTRTDKLAPASDAKIEKAMQSLLERGWANLDGALSLVIASKSDYPDWVESGFAINLSTHLFSGAVSFQFDGLININNSSLTFNHLRLLILRVEKSETFMFVPAVKRKEFLEAPGKIPVEILGCMQAYTGSRVAALHTSQATRLQRDRPRAITEYNAFIRPLFENEEETLNYYAGEADFWKEKLLAELEIAGIIQPDTRSLKWNEKDKKIFVANALPE